MRRVIIRVKDYWTIILFVFIDYNRYDYIEDELINISAPDYIVDEIYDKISNKYNSGFTYSNPDYKTSVVGINKTTSKSELLDTVIHEIDHVQGDICNYYEIELDSEPAAYLIGYLAKIFYRVCTKCL